MLFKYKNIQSSLIRENRGVLKMVKSGLNSARNASFRRFMSLVVLVTLLFSLVPLVHADPVIPKPSKPDLVAGQSVVYGNSYQFINPNNATDGDDTTFTELQEYYHSYKIDLDTPTTVGKIRIVVDDYHKMYSGVPIRFYYADDSYTQDNDQHPNSNDYTVTLNPATAGNITSIWICVESNVSVANPLRVYTVEVYGANVNPPSAPVIGDTEADLTSVGFEWAASTDNETTVDWYNIYQDGTYLATVDGGTTNYTATGLTTNQQYTFGVSAVDSEVNESATSNVVLKPKNLTPPSKVTGLVAVSGNKTATLTWDANGEIDLQGYDVYVDGILNEAGISDTTFEVTDLTNATAYNFDVVAVNQSGTESLHSDIATVTPLNTVAPSAPTNVEVESGNTQVTVTWDDNSEDDILGYDVYVDGDRKNVAPVTATTYLVTGLTNNTEYDFEVVAINTSSLESDKSFIVSEIPLNTIAPAAPTNLVAVSNDEKVNLTWDSNGELDIAGYKIYQDGVQIGNGLTNSPAYTAIGLTNGQSYEFTISAVNTSDLESSQSSSDEVTPLSSNSKLSSLTSSVGSLDPTFDLDDLDYTIAVANSINSIKFTPTVANSGATVEVNGVAVPTGTESSSINLSVGDTIIVVKVTAQDGVSYKNYTVTLTRSAATPTATPIPIAPTQIPTPPPTPKPFYNEKVNIDVIKALVEKASSAPTVKFKDVPQDSPTAKVIELASKLGIVKGYSDGSFHANAEVTRAEFATMLVKALGLETTTSSNFKDTNGHWAANAIATLRLMGIINGYSDGSFKPNQSISKAEIAALLSKLIIKTSPTTATNFNDISGNWAEDSIIRLAEDGIIKGEPNGSFKPNGKATRAESLLMILRMLNVSLDGSLDIE
jgi:hypothetical protein